MPSQLLEPLHGGTDLLGLVISLLVYLPGERQALDLSSSTPPSKFIVGVQSHV